MFSTIAIRMGYACGVGKSGFSERGWENKPRYQGAPGVD